MTQDDIIKMAQECGDWNGETAEFNDVGLERFAALVAANEREKQAEQEPVVKYPGCDYCNDELFCGRKCKCCGKVFIEDEDFVQSEVKSLRQQVAALKAVVDAWNNVEQEPVAWMEDSIELYVSEKPSSTHTIPLYAASVRTKDLTDDEIAEIFSKYASDLYKARAVIAAYKEKNR